MAPVGAKALPFCDDGEPKDGDICLAWRRPAPAFAPHYSSSSFRSSSSSSSSSSSYRLGCVTAKNCGKAFRFAREAARIDFDSIEVKNGGTFIAVKSPVVFRVDVGKQKRPLKAISAQ